ncbi:MAG TPA: PstS family phosphate ABC transporter substrate-binding protein [Chitinophagaceae bacterium]|nr:MAG: phosphate binding protein [Bacteroidetes bacterium OLB11]HMN32383.1 PstS family phosphate ABC transporter substrate-binding protein [Chitinophagaceae bacterium]
MKRIITISYTLVGLVFASNAQKIKGSETVLPISEKAAQVFMKTNSNQKVTVTGGGSGVGFSALIEGSTDIAQASRKIKFSEKQKIQESGNSVKEIIIAYDGLAVIINPTNKVKKLTKEQLEGIFTGKIKNWKEVGGDDLKIIPYSRETSSGTYEFFKEHVLSNKNYMSGIMSMPANGSIIQSVSQTKGAIAYVGLAYFSKSVQEIAVSFDKGKTYIVPSEETVKNKTYPIVRPLFYYYFTKSEATVKKYIDFILSPNGQKIVEEVGYIRIK